MYITLDEKGEVTSSDGFNENEVSPEDILPLIDLSFQGVQKFGYGCYHFLCCVFEGRTILVQKSEPNESRYFQEAVNDAIEDVMVLKDPSGNWIQFNRAAEALRETSPLFDGDCQFLTQDCRNSETQAWATGNCVRQDETLPDGRILDVTKTPIMNPDGTPRCLLVFGRDVTDARSREAQLEALNSMVMTLKTVDRLIIGCLNPRNLVNGVVTTLAQSVLFRNCAAYTVAFQGFEEVFFKAPEDSPLQKCFFHRLDEFSWSEPFIQGEELGRILPELGESNGWIAARVSHGTKIYGYMIAELDESIQRVSGSFLNGMITDTAADLAYALQSMELSEAQKASAEQILDTRNMLDSFLEHFPGPAFIRDSGSRYLKMNGQLIQLFGGEHFNLKEPSEIYPPENLGVLLQRDREVLEKGYVCRNRILLDSRGKERTFEAHYFRMERAGKEPLIGGIALDITERLEADKALLTSEERYRTIYDNTGTAMAIIDPDGLISSINSNTEELTGYSSEETVGIKHWSEFVHPDDRAMVGEKRRSRMEEGGERHFDYEFRLIRKDGTFRYVKVRTGTIPNSGGTGVISLVDVTNLMDYQKQLNHSLEKTQAILEAIPDLMFVLTEEGRYRDFYARDEGLLAFPPEELARRSIFDIGLPGKTSEEVLKAIGDTLSTGTVHHVEYQIELPDGYHYYEAGMSPFESDSVLVLCRDVTARKQAELEQRYLEAQMKHVQKLESLGVLAGGIAHDFNNILMAITGNIFLARKSLEENISPTEQLDEMELAARRASDLAGQMLAYSGRGEFMIKAVRLNLVAEEISGILAATVSKKARIVYSLDPELPLIMADSTQVRQVIMNLLTNASEALEDKPGEIVISTGVMHCDEEYIRTLNRTEELRPGAYAWIQVDDTGKGMDDNVRSRIFDPFFTTKFTGRGLGLSAVLGIMSSHGGALSIQSAPGKGSSFRALFPVSDSGPEEETAPVQKRSHWKASGTVLFVDDEPVIRSVAEAILTSMGFSVITASDGLDGLKRYKENPGIVSLVILDLTMPNMDGDEVFRKIRELSDSVPVLVSSGYNENEILTRFSDCPPDGFLKKPYSALELRSKIGVILHP